MDKIELVNRKRPKVDDKTVIDLVRKLYGLRVRTIQELNAYDDKNSRVICEEDHQNPHIASVEKEGYVLKIMNTLDSKNVPLVEGQNEMMLYLHQHSICCPAPIKNVKGNYYSLENLEGDESEKNLVRLLIYRPGDILYHVEPSKDLLYDVGRFCADLGEKLRGFSHPSYETRLFIWMLVATPKLRDYTFAVKNEDDRATVHEVVQRFETDVIANMNSLEKGIIHGDVNEQNLLVDSTRTKIAALLDFGDTQYTCKIFELMILLCYMIIQAKNIEMGKYVVAGYQSIKKLTDFEKKILKTGVCARLSQSLVLGAYSHLNDPENDYVTVTQKNGWKILRELWPIADDEVLKMWGL